MDLHKPIVAGIGEVLWDLLPTGKQLGGAPLNFSYHCQMAGCVSFPVGAIGTDDLAKKLVKLMHEKKLPSQYLQTHSGFPTGTVSVRIKKGLPTYQIHENVAWDHLAWNNSLESLAGKVDAACFGTLAQRSQNTRETIYQFLGSMPASSLKVFDINLRQDYYSEEMVTQSLKLANILKLNEEELDILSLLYSLKGSKMSMLSQLIESHSLQLVALTMGERGSLLMTCNEISEEGAAKVELIDTVGAGDAFTAVLVTELVKKTPLKDLHKKASRIASWVCSRFGATPEYP